MLYIKPFHWLIPTFLIGYVMGSLCFISLEQLVILCDTLNTVTIRTAIVNSDESFLMRLFQTGQKLATA
jgi:hypothetical protein